MFQVKLRFITLLNIMVHSCFECLFRTRAAYFNNLYTNCWTPYQKPIHPSVFSPDFSRLIIPKRGKMKHFICTAVKLMRYILSTNCLCRKFFRISLIDCFIKQTYLSENKIEAQLEARHWVTILFNINNVHFRLCEKIAIN